MEMGESIFIINFTNSTVQSSQSTMPVNMSNLPVKASISDDIIMWENNKLSRTTGIINLIGDGYLYSRSLKNS